MSSKDKVLFYAIQENNEMLVQEMLKKEPELANAPLLKGATTPLCRATYNGHESMVIMLLERGGADINGKARTTGRSPVMWAAFRGNLQLLKLLIIKGADLNLEDDEGLNCFDIAVIRLQYSVAHYLYKHHNMTRSEEERCILYKADKDDKKLNSGKLYRHEFDVDLFFLYLEQDRETIEDRDVFFEKMRREYQEWLAKDLVIDTRETWKDWFHRQRRFGEAPLIPIEELEEQF